MAEIIASGTSAADSSDFTLITGESCTLFLTGASGVIPGSAFARVYIKDSAGAYMAIDQLDYRRRAIVLVAPGTFRVSRVAGADAFGADKV